MKFIAAGLQGSAIVHCWRSALENSEELNEPEGIITDHRQIFGTSSHGLFDAVTFRRHFWM